MSDKKVLEQMLASGCHFGHRAEKWNPKMRKYLYAKQEGIHIFDLTKTYAALMKAGEFLKAQAAAGKTILLVSTKLQATKLIEEAAAQSSCPFVTRKWIPGLLTNYDTIKKRIKYYKDLKEQKRLGALDKYTKKERVQFDKQLAKLTLSFSGVESLNRVPEIVVVLDALRDQLALKEAARLKIPTVGLCDSNADPDLLTYPIPGNDDAVKSLSFFLHALTEAICQGRKEAPVEKKADAQAQKEQPKRELIA